MKKVVGGLAVSLVLLVGATACGGGDDSGSGATPTTAAADGGSSGSSSDAPSVEEFCALVDDVVAAVKAKDTAGAKEAGVKLREAVAKVTAKVGNDAEAAAAYGPCIQKGALALAGQVENP